MDIRVGQHAQLYCGSDKYAGVITKIEGNVIWIGRGDSVIRCKKNPKAGGYGEQELNVKTGKWVYRYTSKYRYLSTWYPIDGIASTYLDPGF